MKTMRIYAGSEVPTLGGCMVVNGRGIELIYLDEYEYDEDGNAVPVGERKLTLGEIANEAFRADGQRYNVVWSQMYKVLPEYEDNWFGGNVPEPIDYDEIERLAEEFETTVEDLMEQVEEI